MPLDTERLEAYLRQALADPCAFARMNAGITLRGYQQEVALAVVDSVLNRRGLSFVVMFPRQSGKNELQAQLEAYLLVLLSRQECEMVKVSPTWKPQSQNAMRRLERTLKKGLLTGGLWEKESGYIYRVGRASICFFSGEPQANIVGATASTLLEVDEAQDVSAGKYDRDIAPMAASTNATRVFWGTAWTSQTLLARELRAARALEEQDGIRRAFQIDADRVAQELPVYAEFVREQVQRHGRTHPVVRSQFFSEEVEAEAGMFPSARQCLMRGNHAAAVAPLPGRQYAMLLDVGGEQAALEGDANVSSAADRHDSTALTVVELDLSALADPLVAAPIYRVVHRQVWSGIAHSRIYAGVLALAELWQPRRLVVDATGIGAGLAAFLLKALGSRVLPFIFSSTSKSALGWGFLSICDTGRFKDHAENGSAEQRIFWQQVNLCQMQVADGAAHGLRWGVPDGTRNPANGEQVHDDLLISAALCALLEDTRKPSGSGLVRARDPLEEMGRGF
jgi:hypothetical protein